MWMWHLGTQLSADHNGGAGLTLFCTCCSFLYQYFKSVLDPINAPENVCVPASLLTWRAGAISHGEGRDSMHQQGE